MSFRTQRSEVRNLKYLNGSVATILDSSLRSE